MYDPMVAKLIVWDADREQATKRMLRALGEFEIEGLKTLIPFHKAPARDRAVGARRDLPRPARGQEVAEDARLPAARAAPRASSEDTVEQTYTVEVSGRRFDVRVVGPPFAGAARRAAGASANGPGAAAPGAADAASGRPPAAPAAPTCCPRRCRGTCGRCS